MSFFKINTIENIISKEEKKLLQKKRTPDFREDRVTGKLVRCQILSRKRNKLPESIRTQKAD